VAPLVLGHLLKVLVEKLQVVLGILVVVVQVAAPVEIPAVDLVRVPMGETLVMEIPMGALTEILVAVTAVVTVTATGTVVVTGTATATGTVVVMAVVTVTVAVTAVGTVMATEVETSNIGDLVFRKLYGFTIDITLKAGSGIAQPFHFCEFG
jgi:hypothetical protein